MPWTQKQMLRDANGDLIPQYWDVVEQTFKPLTGSNGANDVRLTGSNVEEGLLVKTKGKVLIKQQLNVKISAGGAVTDLWSNVDITEFSDLQFAIRTDSTHNFLMRADFEVKQYTFGPAIEYGNVIFNNINDYRKFSEKIVAKGDLLKLFLQNKDTADHYYDIYLWGFR